MRVYSGPFLLLTGDLAIRAYLAVRNTRLDYIGRKFNDRNMQVFIGVLMQAAKCSMAEKQVYGLAFCIYGSE